MPLHLNHPIIVIPMVVDSSNPQLTNQHLQHVFTSLDLKKMMEVQEIMFARYDDNEWQCFCVCLQCVFWNSFGVFVTSSPLPPFQPITHTYFVFKPKNKYTHMYMNRIVVMSLPKVPRHGQHWMINTSVHPVEHPNFDLIKFPRDR